jgi:hypothetical protein
MCKLQLRFDALQKFQLQSYLNQYNLINYDLPAIFCNIKQVSAVINMEFASAIALLHLGHSADCFNIPWRFHAD